MGGKGLLQAQRKSIANCDDSFNPGKTQPYHVFAASPHDRLLGGTLTRVFLKIKNKQPNLMEDYRLTGKVAAFQTQEYKKNASIAKITARITTQLLLQSVFLVPIAMAASAGIGDSQSGLNRPQSADKSAGILRMGSSPYAAEPKAKDLTDAEIAALTRQLDENESNGNYSKAALIQKRLLAQVIKIYSLNHPTSVIYLNNLAGLYRKQALYDKAELLYVQALEINKKQLGAEHPDTATILSNLAVLYSNKSLFSQAESYNIRALAIKEKTLGPEHQSTAISLNNLAATYTEEGLYSKAEPLLARALAIDEKTFGTEHTSTAGTLNNLANLYAKQGLYSKAEPLIIRAVAIFEKARGPDHPDTATSLENLAANYSNLGLNSKAELLYIRAIEINEKKLGLFHPVTANSLINLASLYDKERRYSKAEPLYKRALEINEKALGLFHPYVANSLIGLALLYTHQRLYAKAEPLIIRTVVIREKVLGSNHPDTAFSLNNLADLYKNQGLYKNAVTIQIKAIASAENALGLDHPNTAIMYNNLAFIYGETKQIGQQLRMLVKAISAQNRWLIREAPIRIQKDRSAFIKTIGNSWMTAFGLASQYAPAAGHALNTRLNRQGFLEEIEQRQSLLLRAPDSKQELARQISALNTELASVNLNANQRETIRIKRDQIEAHLYRLMPDLQLKEVSPAQISALLPANSLLVEFQRFQPYINTKEFGERWGSPQYLAMILKPNGSIKAVPLGPAKPIESAIVKALASTQEALADSQTNWDSVRHLVLDPLKNQLKDSNHWFLSPDAELARIPFLALPAANSGKRLLSDDIKISVLTTGRDLIRLQKPPGASEKAAVIVNPSYALGGASSSVAISDLSDHDGQRRSAELGSKTWKPLPQTQQEGEEIAKLLVVPLISKDQATANHLQSIHGPKVLHIATHGFFQPNQETTPPDLLRTISSDHQLLSGLKTEDPMLRSGLVLAGADNPTANPADDGYLTAAEAAGLQLDGTELVVLSACSTGQGDSKTGEGVYGLQRALTVAGARSTLLSLWKVDDDATMAFMVRYYTLLKEGKGRGEALVQVQREFRTDPAYKAKNWDRPYYWAAWQLTGDWKPIQGL